MARRVAVLIADRAQLSGVAAPTDLLQLVNRFACERTGVEGARLDTRDADAPLSCRWLSIDGAPVRLGCGSALPVDDGIAGDAHYDGVFVCGFDVGAATLASHLAAMAPLAQWIRRQHDAGAIVAASGSGVLLLAESGLLDGRRATAPWWLRESFHRRYPSVRLDVAQRHTRDGRLLCAGSLAGIPALAYRLVEALVSPNAADWLAKTTLIDARPASDSPQAVLDSHEQPADALVAAAQYQLQQRYADKAVLAALARSLAVSTRTLGRHFHRVLGMSPQAYVQTLRIEAAKRMLLRTSLRVDRIGMQVGYSDAGFFKRLFRLQTGMTPAAWRTRMLAGQSRENGDARPA